MTDTIVALSSGGPPAAIAIVRTSGPSAPFVAERIAGSLPAPREAALRWLHHPVNGERIDQALVLSFPAPHSATGEDVVEFHCHGGRAVVAALLEALVALPDVRLAEPGEFTRRALLRGRIDLTEAEGLADLLEAETEAQRRSALVAAGGGLRREIEHWRERLLDASARAEAAIDYVDDEEVAADDGGWVAELGDLRDMLSSWLARPGIELIRDGVRVALAGPPNSGKSSLLNALTRTDRAIVTDIPGTTRDVIEVHAALGGHAFVFVDTAGLRDSDDTVERIGIDRARAEVAKAAILLWLGDPSAAPTHPRRLLVHSRADVAGRESVHAGSIRVSIREKESIDQLLAAVEALAQSILPDPSTILLNTRQRDLIAETAESVGQAVAERNIVIRADHLRAARFAIDRLSGIASMDDMLDRIFDRFCLGK